MTTPATWTNHLGHAVCVRCGEVRSGFPGKRDTVWRCVCADKKLTQHAARSRRRGVAA